MKLKTLINQLDIWRKSYISRTGEEPTILNALTDINAIKFIIGVPKSKVPNGKRKFKYGK